MQFQREESTMAHENAHTYEIISWRTDHEGAILKVMLWQQARRSPVTIYVVLTRAEAATITKEIEVAREEVAQHKLF